MEQKFDFRGKGLQRVAGVLVAGALISGAAFALELPEKVKQGVLRERDVYSRAKLDAPRYRLQNAMVVSASLERTRRVLTHFDLFAGLVPYIDRSKYDPVTRRLDVGGGIWKYRLESVLQFEPKTPDRWEFRIVQGHFLGMRGVMEFRQEAPGKTLVTLDGELVADPQARFPPKLIVEQGAEIIFGLTGRRVRSLVEDLQFEPQDAVTPAPKAMDHGRAHEQKKSNDDIDSRSGIPQPRSGLGSLRR